MRRVILAMVCAAVTAGCGGQAIPRGSLQVAVVAGVYFAARPEAGGVEGAMTEDAPALLARAIEDINSRDGVDLVILAGDLLAGADPLSLDQARARLAELRVPYVAVLGEYDGPPPVPAAADGPADEESPPPAAGLSRSTVIWALQGHGFTGADGYWTREVRPGLVVAGLDTVRPGQVGGHVDAAQLAWLDRTLTANAGKTVIIVGHHALLPLHALDEGAAWSDMLVDNAAEVRAVLERHRNVLAVVSGHHHLAASRVSGTVLYLASPSVSVWPLAYHMVKVTPTEAEAVWIPLADESLARRAQERLLSSRRYRGVFPSGEDGDTACVRLFGGNKMEVVPLPGIRP